MKKNSEIVFNVSDNIEWQEKENIFKKQLSKATGIPLNLIDEHLYIRSNYKFISVNNGYGRSRTEGLRIQYNKDYSLSNLFSEYGSKVTLADKLEGIKTYIQIVLNNEKAEKDFGKLFKQTNCKFFSFESARDTSYENTKSKTISLEIKKQDYRCPVQFNRIEIEITEKKNKKTISYDYRVDFEDSNRKEALSNLNKFQKGISNIERELQSLVKKLYKLI